MLIFELSQPGRGAAAQMPADVEVPADLPAAFRRKSSPGLPEVSELQVVRHYTNLSRKNFSIDPRVVRVNAQLAAEYGSICILHADGRGRVDARPLVTLSVNVQVQAGSRREAGGGSLSWRAGFGQLDEATVAALVAEAVRVALIDHGPGGGGSAGR